MASADWLAGYGYGLKRATARRVKENRRTENRRVHNQMSVLISLVVYHFGSKLPVPDNRKLAQRRENQMALLWADMRRSFALVGLDERRRIMTRVLSMLPEIRHDRKALNSLTELLDLDAN